MKVLALILFAVFAASSAFAYDVADLSRDAKAFHSRHQHELGDMTLKMEGKFTAAQAGTSGLSSTRYQKGDKWRLESGMVSGSTMGNAQGSINTVTLFDGENVWSVAMGMKTKLTKEQSQNQDMKSYWNEPPDGSKIVGEETVNGRDCWIVEWPANPMLKTAPKYWIDKTHFITVKSEGELSGKKIVTEMSDFRAVKDEFIVPYHSDSFSDGKKTLETDITELSINTGLSDDLFDPAKLQGSNAGAANPSGMDMKTMDMDSLMKMAEEMKKKAEEMQKQYQQQQSQGE
jgi:outer membrane lipoprotein-sorting protein